jgi:hypothetical protein
VVVRRGPRRVGNHGICPTTRACVPGKPPRAAAAVLSFSTRWKYMR